MKLKLRFEKDDMIKFLVVCFVLLYVVAIAIANLHSVTSTGEFVGLNPILAFSKDLIASTIIFYIVALVALMVSCKSYFFEFDKGIGVSTEKKAASDGYSKWCDAKDMKKQLKLVNALDEKSEYGGIALINNGKKLYVDNSEYHNLIIGSTGSGKTTAIIYPMIELLAKHGESMVITDPKGELYENKSNMLRSRNYKIVLLNFRDPAKGNAWNPLALPYKLWKEGNQDKAIELLEDLAANILYDEGNKNSDPFWEKTSADYFSGLALSLFKDAKEDEINLNSISLMTTVGEEKFGGNSTYIKEYFKEKDPNSPEYVSASSTILAPSDTKMSILAVFKQKIKLFASRASLSELLSYSNFNIEDIGKQKTALFIVIQDEKKTYHSLVTILLKQIYETLIDVAQNSGGKLPIRTNFLLDEFANMPPLKDVTTMITAARSRQIRFTMIIQNFAQLNEVYGEHDAETIKGNSGNMVYLISTELRALEEISKMCGEIKVKIPSKDDKEKDKEETRPLISVSDLQQLKMNEVIVRRLRMPPFKTKLTPEYEMNWGKKYKKANIINVKPRESREVKVFDLREFVKQQKKNATNNMMSSFSGPNPFGSNPGLGNPFGGNFPGLFDMPSNNDDSKIDFDKIIQNLDKKIAEIEEEEKRITENDIKEDNIKNNNEIIDSVDIKDDKPNLDSSKEVFDILNSVDKEDIEIEDKNPSYEVENTNPESIDDLINKIKEQSMEKNSSLNDLNVENDNNINVVNNIVNDNSIQDNKTNETKEIKEEVNYHEVSDDEFFDDFFDDE